MKTFVVVVIYYFYTFIEVALFDLDLKEVITLSVGSFMTRLDALQIEV